MANDFCAEHSGLIAEKDNLKSDIEKQWVIIDKLQTRLPLWATGIMSLSTFVIGFLVSWIIHLHSIVKGMAQG